MKRFMLFALLALMMIGTASAEPMTCIVPKGQYVNVREKPRSDAGKVTELHNGDEIEVCEVVDGFLRFTFRERDVYASVDYFESDAGMEEYEVVANGRVRLRDAPGGKCVGWKEPGTTASIFGWRYAADGTLWGRVTGMEYISAECLQKVGQGSGEAEP